MSFRPSSQLSPEFAGLLSLTKKTGASVITAAPAAHSLELYRLAGECLSALSHEPLREYFTVRAAEAARLAKSRARRGGKKVARPGSGWTNALARLDAGKRPPVFAKGNGKLPFFAFSSLAGHDCPQAGACLYRNGDTTNGVMSGFCYSFKSWRYPGAYVRQLVNSLRLRTPEGRNEILAAWFALPQGATVRLYVDGDFSSPECVAFWFRAMHARPDLQVYGYSKSWALLLDYQARGGVFPQNYLLNISSGGAGSDSEREAVRALSITRGDFIAVETADDHGRAYQSKKLPGWAAYAADIRQQVSPARVFVCPGRCGSCTSGGHACGSEKFRGVTIAIGVH